MEEEFVVGGVVEVVVWVGVVGCPNQSSRGSYVLVVEMVCCPDGSSVGSMVETSRNGGE